jgi:hypothetical protein
MIEIIKALFNKYLYRDPLIIEIDIINFFFKHHKIKKKDIEYYIKSTNEYKIIYKNNNILNNIYNFYLKRNIDNNTLLLLKNKDLEYNNLIKNIKLSNEYLYKNINIKIWNNFINNIKNNNQITIKKNSNFNCIIVEPRNHNHLMKIVYQFAKVLGDKFQMQIFHGNKNIELIENIKKMIINVKTINLNIDNLTIYEYSELLKKKSFWNNVEGENILVFQTDTYIFKNFPNKYFKYDFIGAPWKEINNISKTVIGNGGLSLRKKSSMLNIIDKYEDIDEINEDVYFCKYFKLDNYLLPEFNIAKKFCVENVFFENPYGLHKPYIELKCSQLSKILNY